MKRILFACMGGMSSSLVALKYQKFLIEKGNTVAFTVFKGDRDLEMLLEFEADYLIAYTNIGSVQRHAQFIKQELFDVILVAPQSKHLIPSIKAELSQISFNADIMQPMPSLVYGRADTQGLDVFVSEILKKTS